MLLCLFHCVLIIPRCCVYHTLFQWRNSLKMRMRFIYPWTLTFLLLTMILPTQHSRCFVLHSPIRLVYTFLPVPVNLVYWQISLCKWFHVTVFQWTYWNFKFAMLIYAKIDLCMLLFLELYSNRHREKCWTQNAERHFLQLLEWNDLKKKTIIKKLFCELHFLISLSIPNVLWCIAHLNLLKLIEL